MSTMRVVIRDTYSACKPYSSTAHSFFVAVFNCDMTLFKVFPCTGVGPGGGRIYGEAEVPQGCYIVVAIATCKNVFTNWALAPVGCEGVACVNLIPRAFHQCLNEFHTALIAALNALGYAFNSPEIRVSDELKKALSEAKRALGALRKLMPEYTLPATLLPALKEAKAEDLVKIFTAE